MATIEEVAAAADFGIPTARKTGRDPRWPYVPVIRPTVSELDRPGPPGHRQVLGVAYATRDEAIAAAARHIEALRASLAVKLANPGARLLREQYGLPRELADV